MLTRLFFPERTRRYRTAADLYHELITSARYPWLFLEAGIPDTLDGRFHAVAIHAALLLPELERRKPEGPKLSEIVYKKIFDGFDAALREEGVGDASIARKIRKMGEEFFGLGQSIQAALSSADRIEQIKDVLGRNEICAPQGQQALANYLDAAATTLGNADDQALLTGKVTFPGTHKSSVG